jgi:class 3 adenylate cyclase/tRNA A-37 threonylcarbamoyl transferase component Bud32
MIRTDGLTQLFSPAQVNVGPAISEFGPSSQALGFTDDADGAPSVLATFLFARLNQFAPVCQAMSAEEAASFVNEVRRMLSDAVTKLGGEIAQRRPDSILAVFTDQPDSRKPDHAQRALHAAVLAVHESVQLAKKVAALLPQAPPLSLAVGVHLGTGQISRRANSSTGMVRARGEAVEVARLLEMTATDLHWSVATSAPTGLAASGRAQKGRIGSLGLPDDTFIDIVEIVGLAPGRGTKTSPATFEALREALAVNQRSQLAMAGAGARDYAAVQAGGQFLVEGYRVLRKIGEGAMASIFLADTGSGGTPLVLKVMRLDKAVEADGLQRFIQEFALLAQVNHPNVARIFSQDFSVGHAYIAMEYFPCGDLRARLQQPIHAATALAYLKQAAAGLAAIHGVGIVHRDLKPENLMLRKDGSLALADFGVAKQVSMLITDTGDGDIVGTPYYLSPEQALGHPVDARCDIYSLGVMFYEMLAGRKPYRARSVRELLNMHVHAPVPQLPPPHELLQPVLARMMAKKHDKRYPSAQALLDDLEALGL